MTAFSRYFAVVLNSFYIFVHSKSIQCYHTFHSTCFVLKLQRIINYQQYTVQQTKQGEVEWKK